MIRSKFKVNSVDRTKRDDGSIQSMRVKLFAVYSNDPDSVNHAFWSATPSGYVEMQINNEAAFDQFVDGAEYYVDFTKAE